MPLAVEVAQRVGRERLKAILVDDVEADQPIDRAVVEGDVELEWLEQFVAGERGEEAGGGAVALVERTELLDRAFEIGGRSAGIVEQARPLLLRQPGAGGVEVDLTTLSFRPRPIRNGRVSIARGT